MILLQLYTCCSPSSTYYWWFLWLWLWLQHLAVLVIASDLFLSDLHDGRVARFHLSHHNGPWCVTYTFLLKVAKMSLQTFLPLLYLVGNVWTASSIPPKSMTCTLSSYVNFNRLMAITRTCWVTRFFWAAHSTHTNTSYLYWQFFWLNSSYDMKS